jgi:hypothetical protein
MDNLERITLAIPNVDVALRERVAAAARAEGRTVASEVRLLLNRMYPADSQTR